MVRRAILATIFLTASTSADGKCVRMRLIVNGEIKGNVDAKTVVRIQVTPDPNELNPSVQIKDQKFHAEILFDTFKSRRLLSGDNCSRRPDTVRVVLSREGKEQDSVSLKFPKDFLLTDGDYWGKVPTVLTVR